MPPRSIYRWKTFWFGLFIILSLAWAWWDSYRNFSGIFWISNGLIYSGEGHIGIGIVNSPFGLPANFETARIPLADVGLSSIFSGLRTYTLPHWLLFESFLILWFLLLGWRTRRHLRKSQRLTDPCSRGL